MKSLKRKTQLLALSVCAIISLFSFVGCGKGFTWKPNPYVGDSSTLSIVNADEERIYCNAARFDEMTCFTPEDIATLKAEIEKLKADQRAAQKRMDEYFKKERAMQAALKNHR